MDRLETRELDYFVAVAQELHFGRAAERLGISQPPLSRAIGRLERRIGVSLFERTSRRVALTAAGGVFLSEALRALDAVDRVVRLTQRVHQSRPLRIAANPGTGSGMLRGLIDAHTRRSTDHEVEMVFTHDQATVLRAGTADVGVLCASADLEGLDTRELASESSVALLPAGHRLADRTAVTVAELHNEAIFRDVVPTMGLDEVVDLVAIGQLAVVVGESAADRIGSAVVPVPVVGLPPTRLLLAWQRGTLDALVMSFVRTAQSATNATVRHIAAS